MAGKPVTGRPKTTIEIPLPSIKKYTRGSGPPPPPITLAPPRDSTAYIIDQFVLPVLKDTKPDSRRRIFYHIGFTDIPAARLLVPCNEVLDYVSPRELEEWEYDALQIKETDKAVEAEQRRKNQEQAPAKKKPGRPPKARLNEPALDAPAEPVISLQEGDVLLAKQEAVGGPSLATPQKRKRVEIPRYDDSDEAAIHLQLQNQSPVPSEVEDSGTDLEGYDSTDPLSADLGPKVTSYSRGNSSGSSAQQPVAGPSKPTATKPSVSSNIASRPSSSVVSTPGRIHPMFARSIEVGSISVSGHGSQKGAGQNGIESSSARKRRKDEQPKPGRKRKKSHIEEPTDSWVVKELLDDQWVTEHGVKVHKYLVLWEGNWPPDQNPTWEPEDNIDDQGLIKTYLKKKESGMLKAPKKTQRSMLSYLSQPQYSSVAEAFEGDIDELQPEAAAVTPESDSDDGDELLVTEEPVAKTQKNGKGESSSFTSFDSKLEKYQKTFSR
ncbi:uncharacterized protein B0T23DRAFT_84729 [Neurospora hispaniola]|uniref:Chromo domain-containing protein n=1 Tax=Neurospora hispaniola TaxID=588809 RepID=A0AAJ0ICZ5_9PEZI|nr:hypothetical protein B0T23DRAFT_84729 [Neurospora hispaniola]